VISGIYLDVNASWGPLAEVIEEVSSLGWLNPSSIHKGGQKARFAVEEARQSVAQLLRLKDGDRVIFTSGATEANNTAIFSTYFNSRNKPGLFEGTNLIVTTAIDHPSVLEPSLKLRSFGVDICIVDPDENGTIDSKVFCETVGEKTRLVSLMARSKSPSVN